MKQINNETMAFMPPDVLWSENSFKSIYKYLSKGKAIFEFFRCTGIFLEDSKDEDYSSKNLIKKVIKNISHYL